MPTHGIKFDLEFGALLGFAFISSFFFTGEIVSNVLFTTLISLLFFLLGLHLKTDELRKCAHHKLEVGIGMFLVYIFGPLTAYVLGNMFGGSIAEAMIAIGFSAAALGAPVVFANRARGEGSIALLTAGATLVSGIVLIPLMLAVYGIKFPVGPFAAKNILFLGLPLSAGLFSQRYKNDMLEDMRHHFSKAGVWLIALIMMVQFQLVFQAQGLAFLGTLAKAAGVMAGYTMVMFSAGYVIPRGLGVMERKARTLAFVSGSKGIAIALFIAAQMSAEAVAFVTAYYFIRQAIMGMASEILRHGEFKTVKTKVEGLKEMLG